MPRSPRLAEVAWDVLATFLQDWQRRPYFWDREIDIQTALAARLTAAYGLLGKESVTGLYEGAPTGYETLQQYSRVACEPPLRLTRPGLPQSKCLPDIVVWKDACDPTTPPHAYDWPVQWACEIKYGIGKSTEWDEFKLAQLVSSGAADEACAVHFARLISNTGNGITWTMANGVYVYRVELPRIIP